MKIPVIAGLLAVGILFLIQGCGETVDPQVAKYRQALLLTQEISGPVTIEDARKEIADKQTDKQEVILVGRVGSKGLPEWWMKGKAMLVVSEGMEGSHYNAGADHDPQSCPFCRWKWKTEDSLAIINFVDKEGKIIPVDSPTLLGVKKDDVVVLRGVAELNESGFLEVAADGVYIRR